MKKILSVLVLFLIGFSLFAVALPASTYMNDPFIPTNPRTQAMGGTGVALPASLDTAYVNPASYASKVHIAVPYVTTTLYNINSNMDAFKMLFSGGWEDAASEFIKNLPLGFKNFMTVEAGLNLGFGSLGFGVNTRFDIFSTPNTQFAMRADVGAFLVAAHRFEIADGFSLDAGVSFHVNYRMFTSEHNRDSILVGGIGTAEVLNALNGSEGGMSSLMGLLTDRPMAAGFAFPIDFGLKLNMPYGFAVGASYTNFNGNYYYNNYDNIDSALAGIGIHTNLGSAESTSTDYRKFENVFSPGSLNIGFAWRAPWSGVWAWINPTITVDFVDLVGLFTADNLWTAENWVNHINIGAELYLIGFLNGRIGLNRGYFTCGVGIDLYAARIDAVYGIKAYGEVARGDSLDYLTVRVSIGYDR